MSCIASTSAGLHAVCLGSSCHLVEPGWWASLQYHRGQATAQVDVPSGATTLLSNIVVPWQGGCIQEQEVAFYKG